MFLQLQLILTEIYYDGFHRTFNDSQPLSDLHETDNIYAIEVPQPVPVDDQTSEEEGDPSTGFITLVLLNKLVTASANQGRR